MMYKVDLKSNEQFIDAIKNTVLFKISQFAFIFSITGNIGILFKLSNMKGMVY